MTDDQPLQFGRFEIHPLQRQLLIDGRSASLGARAFDLLLAFASSPGRLLTKNELLDTVWPNVVVEENNLPVQIGALRKLLGSDVIATIPGHGYRFTARPAPAQPAPLPAAVPVAPAAAPEVRVANALKTNLPLRLPVLIGRDDDLIALDALLQTRALVTVIGAGGIGKTLLAQHVLLRQRELHVHGVCFVELANLAEPGQVVGAISAALGVQGGGGDSALDALVRVAAPLTLLIALDNAEHLIGEVARIATALHAGAPKVTLLVTSQAPLQLGVEHVYRVGTLALPDSDAALSPAAALRYGAVELFTQRAQQVDRRFGLDEGNVAATVALCRRLDGLPLAIGLAAARIPLLGVEGLAAALGERLKLLTSGGRDASSRHRTLRAALEWSHGLLDEREQILFRRLGVVVGSASLELVRRIAVDEALDEWSALDALSVLVERSLVALDAGPGGGADAAAPRYRLLESPRAYAIERLADAGETEALQARHGKAMAEHWARAFDRNHRGLAGLGDWRSALAPDFDNARAAFAWGLANDPVTAVTLAPVLSFMLEADPPAQHALHEAIEPLFVEPVPALLRARALLECSRLMPLQNAIVWARRALELYRAIDDAAGRYLASGQLAWSMGLSGDAEGTAAMVAEMQAVFAAPPAIELAMRGEQAHAALAIAQERWEDVLRHFRRHAQLWLEAGGTDERGFGNVIEAEMLAGHIGEAVRDAEAMLDKLSGSRDVERQMRTHVLVVAASLKLDDRARARKHAALAWPQAAAMDHDAPLADHCALLAALENRPRTAARLVGYADASYAARHDVRQVSEAHSVERALAAARTALGEAEVDRLRAAGAARGVDAAAREALAEDDSAS